MSIAIFLGRISPPHFGHQRIIDKMIEDCGIENCLGIVGSCASPISWRNLFTYTERRDWFKTLFPHLRVIGMPDTATWDVETWLSILDDYLAAIFGKSADITFYGGDAYDIRFFTEKGKKVKIIDRHKGAYRISATYVRALLSEKQDISTFVDSRIMESVKATFAKRNEQFLRLARNREDI